MLDVSVIVVNFRTERLTLECLRHLEALDGEVPREAIVVDNSPERGLGQAPLGHVVRCRYLATPRNIGFASAVNRALDVSRQPIVVLLGPDAFPEPGCLSGLVAVLRAAEDRAIAGPLLLPPSPRQPRVPSALRRDPGVLSALVEYTALHRLVGRQWLDRRYFLHPGDGNEPRACAMVQGACLAAGRELLERVGRLDAERFFVYWEETDLCRRVRAVGGRVIYCPGLVCRHLGGASMADGVQDARLFWRGFFAYHRKYGGRRRVAVLRPLLLAGIGLELAILSGLDLARRGRDQRLRRDRAVVRDRLMQQLVRQRLPIEVP